MLMPLQLQQLLMMTMTLNVSTDAIMTIMYYRRVPDRAVHHTQLPFGRLAGFFYKHGQTVGLSVAVPLQLLLLLLATRGVSSSDKENTRTGNTIA